MKRILLFCLVALSFVACKPIARFSMVGAAPTKATPAETKVAVFVYSEAGVKNQPDELPTC